MICENISKLLAAGLFALLVFVPASTAPAAEPGRKVAVAAFGLFGDQSVFESEAKGAAGIVAKRFGASPVVVRSNTKSRSDATLGTLAATLDSVARKMDAENDILLLILTSHGSRAGLVVKAGRREETLSPWLLGATLRYTGVRHRLVIISACYSGIFSPRRCRHAGDYRGRRRSPIVRLPRRSTMDLFRRCLFQHRAAPCGESEGCLQPGARPRSQA